MAASQTHAAHILLIDDHPEELRPLLTLLRARAMRLSLARDPRQGLQRALGLNPDLVLLNVRIPQINGIPLCRLLRETPATHRTPVIFLTGTAGAEEWMEGLRLGKVDYVRKPCIPEEVLARIHVHLQLHWGEPPVAAASCEPDQLILHAAMRLLGSQLDDVPTLAELARLVGTYDKKLSAIFRRRLGISVFDWIRRERLRKAQEMLTDTRMSIQDIAELVGFSSAANFTTAFRQRLGITPSRCRDLAHGASATEEAHLPRRPTTPPPLLDHAPAA